MNNIRRWYVYLVSLIALTSLVSAVSGTLQSILIQSEEFTGESLANSIAVILVASPIYLIHWYWAQKSAKDIDERQSFTRILYFYLIFAYSIGVLVNNLFGFTKSLIHVILKIQPEGWEYFLTPKQYLISYGISILVFSIVFFLHLKSFNKENVDVSDSQATMIFQQVLNYLFSGIGLFMAFLALFNLLQIVLENIFLRGAYYSQPTLLIASELARSIIGFPVWLQFWNSAQKNYHGLEKEERQSIVRKIYLYAVLFITISILVTSAAMVFMDLFAGWLEIPSDDSSSTVFFPISIFITTGFVWSYHAIILRKDAALEEEIEKQANVRRIYLYLMAGVGLSAFLIGLGGVVSVLIRYLYRGVLDIELREQLAIFTSSLLAGCPVWLLYWRIAQKNAQQLKEAGYLEKRSFIRIYYLYFFIFMAMITILSSLVFIVAQLVQITLKLRTSSDLITDIGQSMAYTLIAIGLVLYHSSILRKDKKFIDNFETGKGKKLNVVLCDFADGIVAQQLLVALQKMSGLTVTPIALTGISSKNMGIKSSRKTFLSEIKQADLIISIVTMLTTQLISNDRAKSVLTAITGSGANKVMVPVNIDDYEWIGIKTPKIKSTISDISDMIRQLKAEGKLRYSQKLSPLAIIMIIIISICLLSSLVTPLAFFLSY